MTRNGVQQLTRARQPTKLADPKRNGGYTSWRIGASGFRLRVESRKPAEVIDELPTLEERLNGPVEGDLLFGVQVGDGGMVAHAITNSTHYEPWLRRSGWT